MTTQAELVERLAQVSAEALALQWADWQPIETAPWGQFHPYEDHPEAATYVLVWNGHHRGVAYCQKDAHATDDEKQWLGEDGHFMPQPTHWQHLDPPPGAATETTPCQPTLS